MDSTSASVSDGPLFPATLFDGQTAARQEVHLRISPGGLQIADRAETWPWREITIERDQAVRLRRGDAALIVGGTLSTPFLRAAAPYLSLPASPQHALWLLPAVALLSLLALYAAFRWGLPALGEFAAAHAPVEWETRLGDSAAQSLFAGLPEINDQAALEGAALLIQRLSGALGPTPYRFRVQVVRSSDVNAFALPGGRIGLFSGMVAFCRGPDELAGVMAHEMMHVVHRDGMKSLGRQASLSLIGLLLGAPDSMALTLGSQLASFSYQRDDEARADDAALQLLARARIDPRAMASLFARMADKPAASSLPVYLSTHPDPQSRAATLLRRAEALPGAQYEPALTGDAWQRLRRSVTLHQAK